MKIERRVLPFVIQDAAGMYHKWDGRGTLCGVSGVAMVEERPGLRLCPVCIELQARMPRRDQW